ncbi:MAG: hypothetical protein AAFO75_08830, partial [Pseudomonadota bacterium]
MPLSNQTTKALYDRRIVADEPRRLQPVEFIGNTMEKHASTRDKAVRFALVLMATVSLCATAA